VRIARITFRNGSALASADGYDMTRLLHQPFTKYRIGNPPANVILFSFFNFVLKRSRPATPNPKGFMRYSHSIIESQ
jgi:hypothetical protein